MKTNEITMMALEFCSHCANKSTDHCLSCEVGRERGQPTNYRVPPLVAQAMRAYDTLETQTTGPLTLTGGRKDDQGKTPWHLFPWDAAEAICRVLEFGAKKYAPRNWEKGMDWDRPFSACIRHLTSWHQGEAKDAETGLSHLWHAGCCILFLISYEIRGIGQDSRPGVRHE